VDDCLAQLDMSSTNNSYLFYWILF